MADVQISLITYLYNAITGDSSLKATCGGTVRMKMGYNMNDLAFPYITHRLDINPTGFFPIQQANYVIDLWSKDPASTEILTMRGHVVRIIDELRNPTVSNNKAVRIWLQTEGMIPDDEQDIWHYAMMFNVRFYRVLDVTNILAR